MIPRRGDIYECPQCRMRVKILGGAQYPPLLEGDRIRCSCGEKLILEQAGSAPVEHVEITGIGVPVV